MLQKFKITTCAFILCLFGLTLMTVSPVFAEDSAEFIDCQKIKIKKQMSMAREKIHCFRDLARKLEAAAEKDVGEELPEDSYVNQTAAERSDNRNAIDIAAGVKEACFGPGPAHMKTGLLITLCEGEKWILKDVCNIGGNKC